MEETVHKNTAAKCRHSSLVLVLAVLLPGLVLCLHISSSASLHNNIPKFRRFSKQQVVKCVDNLVARNRAYGKKMESEHELGGLVELGPIHIAFVGDSRVRQLYMDFLLTIPQHDIELTPKTTNKHQDRKVKSEVLNLLVSFLWRPNVLGHAGDNITDIVRRWILRPQERPNFVLLGMTLHDMLSSRGADYELYRKKLAKLYLLLEELNKSIPVIWLSVYPTYDTVDDVSWKSTEMHTDKILNYANIARKIFTGGKVRYWELLTPLALEYVRACNMNVRDDSDLSKWANKHITPYRGCQDFVHLGSVVLSEATQLFFNNACEEI